MTEHDAGCASPETPKLKDLLVPMQLPGDNAVVSESNGFSAEIQAELDAKLARCARMIIDPAILSPLYPYKTEQRVKLGYNPQ